VTCQHKVVALGPSNIGQKLGGFFVGLDAKAEAKEMAAGDQVDESVNLPIV